MILRLAVLSLRNRLLASVLTAFSIALSVSLLLSVEQVRTGLRESVGASRFGKVAVI